MVKAIAPKAPSGATFMTMPTMPKKACAVMIDEGDERLSALAQREQREAEQDRKEQHLQDLAFGESADHGVGNDVQEVVDDAMLLGLGHVGGHGAGVERAGVDVHAGAGPQDVGDDQRR